MPDRETENRAKYPTLAAVAYLLVPGERRKKAAGHFRKAGLEALKGMNSLARPGKPEEGSSVDGTRQSINID